MDITSGLTLSGAIKDKRTPLRIYLDREFPNPKQLQQEYRARAGSLVVDSQGAPFGTLGTAVDLLVRFLLDPEDVPHSARARFPLNEVYRNSVDELIQFAAGPNGDQRDRALWAVALCVEAWRAGNRFPSIVDELVHSDRFDTTTMLAQAPDAALVELGRLRTLAQQELIPNLRKPFHLGPEFDSSKRGKLQRIAAEADLICNGRRPHRHTRCQSPLPVARVRTPRLLRHLRDRQARSVLGSLWLPCCMATRVRHFDDGRGAGRFHGGPPGYPGHALCVRSTPSRFLSSLAQLVH